MFHTRLFDLPLFHTSARRGGTRPTMLIALFPILIFTTLLLSPKVITYTTLGGVVIRRSELGPLTGSEDFLPKISGTGHDFGAISSESSFDISFPAINPYSYSEGGIMVIRRSELGPLTGYTYSSALVRGPGRDFGAIDGEP